MTESTKGSGGVVQKLMQNKRIVIEVIGLIILIVSISLNAHFQYWQINKEEKLEQDTSQKIEGALKRATVIVGNCKEDSGRRHRPSAQCIVNIKKDGYVIVNLPHTKTVDLAGTIYGKPIIEKPMPYRTTTEGLESIEYTARCFRKRSYRRRKSCTAKVFVGVLAVKESDYNETLKLVIQEQPNLFPPVSCEPEKETCSWNDKVFSKNLK